MTKPRCVPTGLQFFRRLKWLDGTPLIDRVEAYRRAIYAEALDARDGRGQPRYNLVLAGRAKKNWKSADLILAALYRLLAWDSPAGNQCYVLCNDADQARDDLEIAVKIVKANPILLAACRISKDGIDRKDGRGFLRILPAGDIAGSHGKTYSFVGFDEIHSYRDWSLLEAMQHDPSRPDALMWVTSYASLQHRPGVPLYDLLQKGKARTDPRMLFSWYAADFTTDSAFADADPEDRANPSRGSWEQADYLEQQRRRLPTVRFRRLHLNLPGYPDGGAFDATKLDAAVALGVRIRPPEPGVHYRAFCDMSGGSSDSATLAIGHREGTLRVVDRVADQGRKPPFDPRAVIPRFAAICMEYGVFSIAADTYGRKAPTLDFENAFRQAGMTYRACELSTPALYEAFEVPLNSGELVLPDDSETLEQLAGLQSRGGKIDHRSGEHDDKANAVAGVVWLLGGGAGRSLSEILAEVHFGGQRDTGALTGRQPHDRDRWSAAARRGDSSDPRVNAYDSGRMLDMDSLPNPWDL